MKNSKKTLTIFTPTYNRIHTLKRTYESLCRQSCKDFEWLVIDDGSTDNTREQVAGWIAEGIIPIRYIYKDNGGLHTGYNTAYENIDTVLNVCIDSDDYMPDDAVEKILKCWKERGSEKYAGIIGLDYYADTGLPIGGKFPENLHETHLLELSINDIHHGDTKQVMRTDVMKQVAPQIGFPGEKNFNPVYMFLQVDEHYPLIVLNENLCNVEYQQTDSMSKAIFRQYVSSPRSFAKLRILEMQLSRNTWKNRFRSAVHYVSSCLISQDGNWLKNSPKKLLTIMASPFGMALFFLIKYKNRN